MAPTQQNTKPLEFQNLEIQLAQMAALVETNLADTITAFERRDITSAQTLIESDARVDAYHQAIEMGVYKLLENQLHSSKEIRDAMTMIKIAADLERVGDLAKNVARRLCVISRERFEPNRGGVARMGRMSLQQFSDVLNAYAARDLTAAIAVWESDEEVDELYHSVFRELLLTMREEPNVVNSSAHMVFIAKNFERVADHATNIAEALHFLMTGEQLNDERPKSEISPMEISTLVVDKAESKQLNTLAPSIRK